MANCELEAQKIRYVFHSLESVVNVLRRDEFVSLQEVKDLMMLLSSHSRREDGSESDRNKVFVVLEGLDGSGKTTVGKELAKAVKGVKFSTPPKIMKPLRSQFDVHPSILRRAYYAVGNYLAAREIDQALKIHAVVLDRFWHSTAVFTIAEELQDAGLGSEKLPLPGDPIYRWPQDLNPVPDAIFYLDVDEHTRLERLSRREQAATVEEKHMESSSEFRTLLKETYHRMADPGVTVIDSNQPVKGVVNDILSFMKNKLLS